MSQRSRPAHDAMHQRPIGRRTLLAVPPVLLSLGGRAALARASAAQDPAVLSAGAGPSSAAIHAMLSRQIDPGRESLGYVAAIIDANGTRVVTAVQSGAAIERALDGDGVFEIGSITKVFTALLLADMAHRGEVALDDPVAKYLPPQARPRAFDGKPITPLDLATYTSGLPRISTNFHPADPRNPYAGYTLADLNAFVSAYRPRFAPGTHYIYANVGFALLGQALAFRAGRRYEDLIVARICNPLGLGDTRIALIPEMRRRLVPGHDSGLRPTPNWDMPGLAPASSLHSTANDLLRFLAACQGRRHTSLAPAMASLLLVHRPTYDPEVDAAEGWFIDHFHSDELVAKAGDTGGYAAFAGYSTRSRIAAVLLSNARSWQSTPGLGRHLLNPAYPAPLIRRPIKLDPAALAAYAGRYPLRPRWVLTIRPEQDRLMMRGMGFGETELFPYDKRQFFMRELPVVFNFHFDGTGRVVALTLYLWNAQTLYGKRLAMSRAARAAGG